MFLETGRNKFAGMKEFVLIFRLDILSKDAQPDQTQMQIYMQQWMQWLNKLTQKDRLADSGNHLQYSGRVLRADGSISQKPYASGKESVAGFLNIFAKDLDEATLLAKDCPILQGSESNSVEIREIGSPG